MNSKIAVDLMTFRVAHPDHLHNLPYTRFQPIPPNTYVVDNKCARPQDPCRFINLSENDKVKDKDEGLVEENSSFFDKIYESCSLADQNTKETFLLINFLKPTILAPECGTAVLNRSWLPRERPLVWTKSRRISANFTLSGDTNCTVWNVVL